MDIGYKIKLLGVLLFSIIKECVYFAIALCILLPIGVLVGLYKSIFGGGYYDN